MNIAIIALTDQGVEQGRVVRPLFDDSTLFVSRSTSASDQDDTTGFEHLKSLIDEQFDQYDAFLCIMAAGIVVRLFGPHLDQKNRDPAVLVLDETGSHVIPLISGHLGGANLLARNIAGETEAEPVITTATDVNNVPAIDERKRTAGMKLHPLRHIKTVNLALLDGERIHVLSDEPLNWSPTHFRIDVRKSSGPITFKEQTFSSSCGVVVSNRTVTDEPECRILYLRPKNVYIGIGYRENRKADQLISEIESALERCYKHQSSLAALCTIDMKAGDPEIEKASDHFDVPVQYFDSSELEAYEDRCNTSEFVKETTGAGSVCEAAALAATSEQSTKRQDKTVRNKITTALVEDTFPSPDSARETRT